MKLLISLALFSSMSSQAFAIDIIRCISKEANPYPDQFQVLTIDLTKMLAEYRWRARIDQPMELKIIKDYGKSLLFRGADPIDVNRIQFYIPKFIINTSEAGVKFEAKVTEGLFSEYGGTDGYVYHSFTYKCSTVR